MVYREHSSRRGAVRRGTVVWMAAILLVAAAILGAIALVNEFRRPVVVTVNSLISPKRAAIAAPADRAAILALIPSTPGSSAPARSTANLGIPDDVATAARAVAIPLADPITLAQSLPVADPALVSWLQTWRRQLDGGQASHAQDRTQLHALLARSPLDWPELIRVGKVFEELAYDPVTACIFFEAATDRGDRELQKEAPGSPQSQRILTALNDCRRLLWDAEDRFHDDDALKAIGTISADLVKWVLPDDRKLGDARRHGLIGVPEVTYVSDQPNVPTTMISSIDMTGMTENEKLGVEWLKGNALYDKHDYKNAADPLKFVFDDVSYQYAEQAGTSLFMCLYQTGRIDDARQLAHIANGRYGATKGTRWMAQVVESTDFVNQATSETK